MTTPLSLPRRNSLECLVRHKVDSGRIKQYLGDLIKEPLEELQRQEPSKDCHTLALRKIAYYTDQLVSLTQTKTMEIYERALVSIPDETLLEIADRLNLGALILPTRLAPFNPCPIVVNPNAKVPGQFERFFCLLDKADKEIDGTELQADLERNLDVLLAASQGSPLPNKCLIG